MTNRYRARFRRSRPGAQPGQRRARTAVALVVGVATAASAGAPSSSLTYGGRIFAPDDGSLEGVRVVATDGWGTYEAVVDSSGLFVGAFPTPPAGPVTLRVFMDSGARYHPSVVTLGPGLPERPTRIVLVPTRWTITAGTFAGRHVRIDPIEAVSRVGGAAGFWRVTRRSRIPARPVSWVLDSFPIRVAFRRERQDPRISAADSAGFWALAAELERNVGRELFRPAPFEEIDRGADGILVTIDRGMSAAGRTFITYDESGRIFEALVSLGQHDYLTDPRVTMHELLHAIGFGNTAGWASVMSPSTRGIARPTPEDVAYAQLYYAISALQRAHAAPYAMLEAGRDIRF